MLLPFLTLLMLGRRQDTLPPIPLEFRAAWVATVANIDWPSKPTLTSAQQQVEMRGVLDSAQRLHLNAIILQVRPAADALYPSKLEPWSEYLTGRQGRAPSPSYDPLAMWVDEAHRRGIELHVWLNPYRAMHSAHKGPLASNHVSKTNPRDVKTYAKQLWMDPGSKFVQQRTLSVVRDIVDRYDIDGVHIDDYFYPYPEGGVDFPDEASYQAYRSSGGDLSRGDWRRKNVDDFVRDLYESIKAEKRWVRFGISPFGIYRPGIPNGIKAGVDQYAGLYADAKKWLNEGWCDYFTPQLYWPIAQKAQSYPVLLDWWASQNSKGRNLWPGLFTSRTMPSEGGWSPEEIANQIRLTRAQKGFPGNAHFSMKAFLQNSNGVADTLLAGVYAKPAFMPPSPWLSTLKPPAIRVVSSKITPRGEGYDWKVSWAPQDGVERYAINRGTRGPNGPVWGDWSPLAEPTTWVSSPTAYLAIVPFNRYGNAGEATIVSKDE